MRSAGKRSSRVSSTGGKRPPAEAQTRQLTGGLGVADLTGTWEGWYAFPHSYPVTRFIAFIQQSGEWLSGTISDDSRALSASHPGEASFSGRLDGPAVMFLKTYDAPDEEFDDVSYQGVLSPDELTISGTWTIHEIWSGTFTMQRGSMRGIERQFADDGAIC